MAETEEIGEEKTTIMNNDVNFFRNCFFTKVGLSHEYKNRPCEDNACSVYNEKTKVSAVALSDGAGSCENSRYGSEIAVSCVLKIISEKFEDIYKLDEKEFAEYIRSSVIRQFERTAQELECSIESMSATLLCAALHKDGRYVLFHVGDGVIAGAFTDGQCGILSQYNHEIAPNFTDFITSQPIKYNFRKGRGGISAFLLMSDGPEEFLVKEGFLTDRCKLLIQISHFMSLERMKEELSALNSLLRKRGMTDDASYAILSDKRNCGNILFTMNPDIRNRVFGIPVNVSKKVLNQYADAFDMLSFNNGIDYKSMIKIMHTHNISRTYNKLDSFMYYQIIKAENGKFYF